MKSYKREEYKDLWQALAEKVGGDEGEALTLALLDFYTVFPDSLPEWFARLYDARIGGFYFSNSARDLDGLDYHGEHFGLLPDADSTCQAMWTLASLGMLGEWEGKCKNAFPERMSRDIVKFIKGLQDPDGYVYHPQFPRKRNEERITRRSRDTGRAASVLSALGASFTYDTPLGHRGDGIDPFGNPVLIPSATCAADTAETSKSTASPPFMKDEKSFRTYLDTLTLRNNSYSIGSLFVTQADELKNRDRQLRESGDPTSLLSILIEWFSDNQLENGTWNDTPDLAAVSGIMKICRLYSAAGVVMPRVRETVRATVSVITSDLPIDSITSIFNPWYALNVILGDLAEIGGDEGAILAAEIRRELISKAPLMLKKTKERLLPFLRADGAFSYPPNRSGGYNMGMPLGLANIDEGDMNATHLASGLPSSIFSALGLSDFFIPVFAKRDMDAFLAVIEAAYAEIDAQK